MLQLGFTEDNTGINPYGRAIYDFTAQYPNELTFSKDEIIRLIKHVDSHWTLGEIAEDRGIFPTSYVDIIVDCIHGAVESFLRRPLSTTEIPKFEGYAIAEHDYVRVELSDVTVSAGETIKVNEIIDENWAIVESLSSFDKGMCPRNHFKMLTQEETNQFESSLVVDIEPLSNAPAVLPQAETSTLDDTALPLSVANITTPTNDTTVVSDTVVVGRTKSNVNILSTELTSTKRVYSKDDFGPIKSRELDIELDRNLTMLDKNRSSFVDGNVAKGTDHEIVPAVNEAADSFHQITKAENSKTVHSMLPIAGLMSELNLDCIDVSEIPANAAVTKIPPTRPPLPARPSLEKCDNRRTPLVEPNPNQLKVRKHSILSRQSALSDDSGGQVQEDLLNLNDEIPGSVTANCLLQPNATTRDDSLAPPQPTTRAKPTKTSSIESSTAEFPADVFKDSVDARTSYSSKYIDLSRQLCNTLFRELN